MELDRDLAKAMTSPVVSRHNTVHGQIDIIVDPARGAVILSIQGKQLVGVDVEELQAIVRCGQFVSHVEGEDGVGLDGHEVVLTVKQAIGSTSRVVTPVEQQLVLDRVDLRVIALGTRVSSWVLRIRTVRG